MNIPEIKPHDWITIGSRNAVVCNILEKSDSFIKVEIVYLDDKNQAINEDAKWESGKWKFITQSGGYADKYSRLNDFVSQLLIGRYR